MTARQILMLRRLRRTLVTGRVVWAVLLVAMAAVAESWPWIVAAALVGLVAGAWEQVHDDMRDEIRQHGDLVPPRRRAR